MLLLLFGVSMQWSFYLSLIDIIPCHCFLWEDDFSERFLLSLYSKVQSRSSCTALCYLLPSSFTQITLSMHIFSIHARAQPQQHQSSLHWRMLSLFFSSMSTVKRKKDSLPCSMIHQFREIDCCLLSLLFPFLKYSMKCEECTLASTFGCCQMDFWYFFLIKAKNVLSLVLHFLKQILLCDYLCGNPVFSSFFLLRWKICVGCFWVYNRHGWNAKNELSRLVTFLGIGEINWGIDQKFIFPSLGQMFTNYDTLIGQTERG